MRSLLFVPGDAPKKIIKAAGTAADGLILDLEDSVAESNKGEARRIAVDGYGDLRSAAPDKYLIFRINDLATPHWQADIAAIAPLMPDAIMLPKARGGDDVSDLASALDELGNQTTSIIALATETPIALLQMQSFVGATERLSALTWGAEDLSAAIGASSNRDSDGEYTSPFRLARDLCLITAAAAGVTAIDTVYTDIADLDGLKAESAAAARDGFTAKMAIHPAQIEPINSAFTPSPEAIAMAEAIVAKFSEVTTGVVALDGQMLDRPHLVRAQQVLARARLMDRN